MAYFTSFFFCACGTSSRTWNYRRDVGLPIGGNRASQAFSIASSCSLDYVRSGKAILVVQMRGSFTSFPLRARNGSLTLPPFLIDILSGNFVYSDSCIFGSIHSLVYTKADRRRLLGSFFWVEFFLA